MNEPVKHATREAFVKVSMCDPVYTEAVRCVETEWHGDAGAGRARRNEKLVS